MSRQHLIGCTVYVPITRKW